MFKRGMKGEGVKSRQQWLKAHGYYHGSIDGEFGLLTEQAVKLFEQDARIEVNGIIGPDNEAAMARWLLIKARNKAVDNVKRVKTIKVWDGIAVHWAASPPVDNPPETINQWHRARGFNKGGYHFVIQGDKLYCGDDYPKLLRRSNEIGAHAKGFNTTRVGVCVFTNTEPTKDEYALLIKVVKDLKAQGNGRKDGVKGHKELPYATACPGKVNMAYVRKETK